jgi:hypothetical protein
LLENEGLSPYPCWRRVSGIQAPRNYETKEEDGKDLKDKGAKDNKDISV